MKSLATLAFTVAIVLASTETFTEAAPLMSETWKISQIDRTSPSPKNLIRINFQKETLVDHPRFQIRIPKGWSCKQGRTERAEALTCTPGADVENDKTTFVISRLYKVDVRNLDQLETSLKKVSSRKVSRAKMSGQAWVLATDSVTDGEKFNEWIYTTSMGSSEWLTLVMVPESKASSYEASLRAIAQSMFLK